MNEQGCHKEKVKTKPNPPVGIIPSNYAKSHKINSDLPHLPQNKEGCSTSADQEISTDTSGKSDTNIVAHKQPEIEVSSKSDKKFTPKKKTRRSKTKEGDDSEDISEHTEQVEEEPKPRIVLTFRSEKPGLRSSNMKIVSPDEKSQIDELDLKRLTRSRQCGENASTSQDVDSDSSHKSPQKMLSSNYESDEVAESISPPTLKRSSCRRSKEFSETVLANAIARKEKYNETVPMQRLITRQIKPTAKVLANRELKLSLETANNARLGSEKSPEEDNPRRSARRRPLRGIHSKERSHSPHKSGIKRGKGLTVQDSDDEVLKPRDNYLSVDQIKQHIMGSSTPQAKASLKADHSQTHSQENRRFNRLKKKHLSKLGLRAVIGTNAEISNSNDNLTDDSTMDSTNTDAIVEHLNAQKEQIDAEKLAQQEEMEEVLEDEEEDIEDEEDAELLTLLKEGEETGGAAHGTETDTSDEEFAYTTRRSRPDTSAATPRVTRKAARLQQPHDLASDQSDEERIECSSPAGGEEGSTAVAPNEGAHHIAACLCTSASNVYITPEAIIEPMFCRAVVLVNGARVGCSHRAARAPDGQYEALRRASVRAPYFLACPLHLAQLRRHLCCPTCGVFCTRGIFYQCSSGHVFHAECGVAAPPAEDEAPGCPHCGGDPRGSVALNRACVRVRVDLKCTAKQTFLNSQRLQSVPACMSFSCDAPVTNEGPVPPALLPPAPVSLTSLRQRGEAAADYEELLTSSAEQRLCQAIAVTRDPEGVLTKLINGVDLHQQLDSAEGGTFLHVAARSGNLTATYLLLYAGCKVDAVDSQLRTPLMAAVLSLVRDTKSDELDSTEAVDKKEDDAEAMGEKELQQHETDVLSVVRYLMAAGCNVNFQGAEGVTALHLVAQHGLVSACEALLESGRTHVDARDHGGWTPLVWAAEHRRPDVIRLLLRHGASALARDAEGNGALHWCALSGCGSSLQLLLDAAPPHAVDIQNPHGDTALHVAARKDHYPCVVILLARGGRTDIKNSSHELAVDCARSEARTAISLNMQMSLMARDRPPRHRLLSSDISRGREEVAVSCVNELDDTPLPDDFTYVTRHVMPQYIRLHDTLATIQGCECSMWCGAGDAECACAALGVRRWYSEGRLVHDFPFGDAPMLFECNETCKCDLTRCGNAVVTRALRRGATFVRAQVFRCREPRGWGLRALAPIPRGTPVALYCGELLQASLADARTDDQYMFAMEVKQDLLDARSEEALCVDARAYGASARFINHSCRANVAPVRVFAGVRDVRAPHIVLFATANIAPFDELTFNYGDKFWSVKSKTMQCSCGTPDCRYPTSTK